MVIREPIVSLENVIYAVDGKKILSDISLSIPAGSMSIVIGENGAGKTSLLDLISRDVDPESGRILIGEDQLKQLSLAELALKRAYLRQHQTLMFDFQVDQVIRLGCQNATMSAIDDVVAEVINKLGLENLSNRRYTSLSGGEKQRVQIARVLAQCWSAKGKLCLLDEPLSSLDIRHQMLVMNLLKERVSQGLSVIIVMHDLALAKAWADQLIVLSNGSVEAVGTPKNVLTPELVKKAFDVEWPLDFLR